MPNLFVTDDEYKIVNDYLIKIRKEKEEEEKYTTAFNDLEDYIISLIDTIGLVNTKKIIREINNKLKQQKRYNPLLPGRIVKKITFKKVLTNKRKPAIIKT